MRKNQKSIEAILVNGLSHVLKRTIEVGYKDRLAIVNEYREWINCLSENDFSAQDILIIDKYTFD